MNDKAPPDLALFIRATTAVLMVLTISLTACHVHAQYRLAEVATACGK